jgi:hypothetical protein
MATNTRDITPNKFLKTISMLHLMLLMGLVMFAGFLLFQFDGAMMPTFDTNDTLLLIYPVVAIAAIVGSQALFKNVLASKENNTDLKVKLANYQTASIIKYALIEGPAFFGILLATSTGNTAYAAIAGVLIIYFILQKPSLNKIESDLKLSGEQRNQFNRYDELID